MEVDQADVMNALQDPDFVSNLLEDHGISKDGIRLEV